MIIQIGGQYGDPKASDYFFPLQKKFNDLFKTHISGEYFQTLGKLSIVFRVSGKVTDFGSEGPERLKYLKKNSELTIDLVFPEVQWRDQDSEFIRSNVKDGVGRCIKLLVEKAEEIGELMDKESLYKDLEQVFSEF